jgi:hypothetical protein
MKESKTQVLPDAGGAPPGVYRYSKVLTLWLTRIETRESLPLVYGLWRGSGLEASAHFVVKEKSMRFVTVVVPPSLNLEQLQGTLGAVFKKTGHPFCISGMNINFESTIEDAINPSRLILAVDKATLNVTEVKA